MRIAAFAAAAALAVSIPCAAYAQGMSLEAQRAMLKAYLKTELANRVVAEAAKMGEGAGDDVKAEIAKASGGYRSAAFAGVRRTITAAVGEERAKESFVSFVNAFVAAEKKGDASALGPLAVIAGLDSAPDGYAELRSSAMKVLLAADIDQAGKFLGGVQTWMRLRARGDVPPLAAWLDRDRMSAAGSPAQETAAASRPKARSRNSLRDAEAATGKFVEAKDDSKSSLRAFSAMRNTRREKRLKDAEAGMAQVAAERRSADDEAVAKKMSAAQAEAQALQMQAQRLAAAEQEAVVQDQNSWRTRLKNVAATAVGAAGSAFLGNVGGRLGEAAAEAVFKDDRRPPR